MVIDVVVPRSLTHSLTHSLDLDLVAPLRARARAHARAHARSPAHARARGRSGTLGAGGGCEIMAEETMRSLEAAVTAVVADVKLKGPMISILRCAAVATARRR